MVKGAGRQRSKEVVHQPFRESPAELARRTWDEEEKFAKIFRFNPVAMSIISAPEGRFVEVNPEFCRMTGYTREEAIGRTAEELGLTWPEDGAGALVDEETGGPGPASEWGNEWSNLEASIRHKSGDARMALLSCERLELGGQDCVLAAFRDITERRRMEEELRVMNLRLREWVVELERRTADVSLLGQMADLLQSCLTSKEAYEVVAHSSRLIFPEASGTLYLRATSSQLMEAVANWGPDGKAAGAERGFEAEACWALRLGRTHSMGFGDPSLFCHHVLQPTSDSLLCVPLMTKGEALGVYHLRLERQQSSEIGPRRGAQELAQAVAEHIAMALGNLQLRETLRQQSTRDPLTGLFNRRHMEESLGRELLRAQRSGRPLAVILFDLDHFKRFNDTFGHEAGDYLLKELATRLSGYSRKEDIACRYGGEEFLLIMPEASLEIAAQRADLLRTEVKRMIWECRGRTLGPLTLSCGVSAFPGHGKSADGLLQAADLALYQAKHDGRDRVVVAPERQAQSTGG
jgi:diguanylate cyclase (GGDEF)-like protein/PAS domain S-box-containing protein